MDNGKKHSEEDVREAVDQKNAELAHQEELAQRSKDKRLDDYDKTLADTFPTSDPPQAP